MFSVSIIEMFLYKEVTSNDTIISSSSMGIKASTKVYLPGDNGGLSKNLRKPRLKNVGKKHDLQD